MTTMPAAGPVTGPFAGTRETLALTRRSLLHLKTNPEEIIELVVQPIVIVLMFTFVFGGAIKGDWRDYLQFALPGMLVQATLFATMRLGTALGTDFKKGVYDRFRSLPIARFAPLTGAILGEMVRYLLSIVVLLIVGALLGFRIQTGIVATLAAVLLLLGFGFAMSWGSALLGLTMRAAESASEFAFLIILPLAFTGNLFVPTDTMPDWLQVWVNINPVTSIADTLRGLLLGGEVARPLLWSVVWIAGLTLVFAPLSIRRFRTKSG
ncbi:ABC transporter permease [Spongiactinospora sp. 9N601]|uniref:ABC transporter permease n=1 Tax=Spongiactinospora sp. 9N601 TaxID=3375149 RepID=UPI00379F0E7D